MGVGELISEKQKREKKRQLMREKRKRLLKSVWVGGGEKTRERDRRSYYRRIYN